MIVLVQGALTVLLGKIRVRQFSTHTMLPLGYVQQHLDSCIYSKYHRLQLSTDFARYD